MMMMPKKVIELDAQGQVLGRLASRIALILQGKHDLSFANNKEGDYTVKVKNAPLIKVTGQKPQGKIYRWYSGYPGGLKERKFQEMFQKSPVWVLRHAVSGMLPKNRLRTPRLKRLLIT